MVEIERSDIDLLQIIRYFAFSVKQASQTKMEEPCGGSRVEEAQKRTTFRLRGFALDISQTQATNEGPPGVMTYSSSRSETAGCSGKFSLILSWLHRSLSRETARASRHSTDYDKEDGKEYGQ